MFAHVIDKISAGDLYGHLKRRTAGKKFQFTLCINTEKVLMHWLIFPFAEIQSCITV